MKTTYVALIGTIVLLSIIVFTLLLPPIPQTLREAEQKAITFCDELNEPDALLMLDVMHRKFGIEEFSDSLERFDRLLSELPEQETAHLLVFRRIADSSNVLRDEDWQALLADIDFFIIPALYCDRLGIPLDYPEMLRQKANEGDLQLTHVLLACIWIQENGCMDALSGDFVETVYHANAALINDDLVVTEVELEAAAFLYLAGQGPLIIDSFVERVLDVQNPDGGWPRSNATPSDSHWHSTILGLLLLLHAENPASTYPPMLASNSP